MKVMVTGGTGFVGSQVCKHLLRAGHEVTLLVRNVDKAHSYYAASSTIMPGLAQGDITDADSVLCAMLGCDAVVHAAATTPIAAVSEEQMFAVNVGGTRAVMDAAVAQQIDRIVHVSSITAIFNVDGEKVHEESQLTRVRQPYGRSKMEAESYVRTLQARGAPVAIVYPGGIVGPDDPGFSDSFKALSHRINNGFRLFDDGGMQYVDVRDLAAFIGSLVAEGGSGRFLLPGVYSRWTELADILDEVTGLPVQRIPARGWKMRVLGRCMDFLRLFKTIDSPVSAETMRYATQWPDIANTAELGRRGLQLRSARETFRDSLAWMLAAGYLDASQAPALANSRTGPPEGAAQ